MPYSSPHVRRIHAATIGLAILSLPSFGIPSNSTTAAHANPITCSPVSTPLSQPEDAEAEQVALPGGDDAVEPMCAGGIPNRLLTSGGGVKLSAFPTKTKTGYKESRGQAWSIDKDTAGHGDRAWKLKDTKGERVASPYSDGMIAKIY